MIQDISTKEDFEKIISDNIIVIAIFVKKDCEECNKTIDNIKTGLIPHIEKIERISVVSIGVENEFFKEYFKISGIPTTILFFKGQIISFEEIDEKSNIYKVDRFIGNSPELSGNLFRLISHLFKSQKD